MIPRWSMSDLPAALSWLGQPIGEAPRTAGTSIDGWLDTLGAEAELDLQRVSARAGDLEGLVRFGGPAIARIGHTDEVLIVLAGGRRRVTLLGPNLRRVRVPVHDVLDVLGTDDRIEPLVAGLSGRARVRARRALAGWFGQDVGAWWLCRPPVDASLWAHLREQGLGVAIPAWLVLHLLAYGLWVTSFVWMGRAALSGALEPAWIAGWVLLFASAAPLRAATLWLQGRIATRAGVVLKQRLLVGALALPLDEARRSGSARMFGRVHDSDVLERLALDGGLGAVLSGAEWLVAVTLLIGGGAAPVAVASIGFVAALGLAARALRDRRRRWIRDRQDITAALVENVLGASTRAVQAAPERWHDEEDAGLERYTRSSRDADALGLLVRGLPALWLPIGLAAIGPSFVAGAISPAALAGAFGGVLLIGRALDGLARGASDLVTASIAFEQVADLLRLARARPSRPSPEVATVPPPGPSDPVLELRGAAYRYGGAEVPVLTGVQLAVRARERILVRGASGSGKSTLTALILGLRRPTAGTVLLAGLDRSLWGASGWREQVTGAPQFHDNHLLGGTLAFNLLLGRRWPPEPDDLQAAGAVCRQLGLGPLLDLMPAGLHQIVGETGWQLSHGERSRVYLARALLQDARVVVLDESMGALDAQSTEWCLYRANAIAGALIVVAHP